MKLRVHICNEMMQRVGRDSAALLPSERHYRCAILRVLTWNVKSFLAEHWSDAQIDVPMYYRQQMGRGFRFVRQAIVLKWTVMQALANYAAGPHRSAQDRAAWMHRWCEICMRRLGVRYSVTGEAPRHGLVVSNHLSYLDIMIFGAVMRCVFVSRAEVKSWPVFGWLTSMAGTVYVDRSRRSDTRNANEGISRAIQHGLPVVVFPEGMSSGGAEVLPFYPSLFEPAVENAVAVTAAYL